MLCDVLSLQWYVIFDAGKHKKNVPSILSVPRYVCRRLLYMLLCANLLLVKDARDAIFTLFVVLFSFFSDVEQLWLLFTTIDAKKTEKSHPLQYSAAVPRYINWTVRLYPISECGLG